MDSVAGSQRLVGYVCERVDGFYQMLDLLDKKLSDLHVDGCVDLTNPRVAELLKSYDLFINIAYTFKNDLIGMFGYPYAEQLCADADYRFFNSSNLLDISDFLKRHGIPEKQYYSLI